MKPIDESSPSPLHRGYVSLLIAIVRDRGHDPALLLRGTSIPVEKLDVVDAWIDPHDAQRVAENAFELTGDDAIALEYGLRSKPTMHGFMGYAAMCCATLRDAIELMLRFLPLRQRDLAMTLSVEGDVAAIDVAETNDLGPLRRAYVLGAVASLVGVVGVGTGERRKKSELWFDFDEPRSFTAYRERLPPARFAAPSNGIRFPAAYLDRRLPMADAVAAKQGLAQCEREAALQGAAPVDLVTRVRAALTLGSRGYPDLTQVASILGMSSRTLKRHLQAHGTSFTRLLDHARRRDAVRLLEDPQLDVARVAEALGYGDPPSFTRAFRRWTGDTPTGARRRVAPRP
jgi:AraC-like DNA-binding protein